MLKASYYHSENRAVVAGLPSRAHRYKATACQLPICRCGQRGAGVQGVEEWKGGEELGKEQCVFLSYFSVFVEMMTIEG